MPPRLLRNLLNSTFQCLSKSIKLDQKKEKRVKIHPFRKKKKKSWNTGLNPFPTGRWIQLHIGLSPHVSHYSPAFCLQLYKTYRIWSDVFYVTCLRFFFFFLERFNQNNLTVSGNTTRQEYSIFPMSESWGLSKSSFHVPISKRGLIFPTDFFC